MFSYVMHSPYRFLLAAGLVAALLCLFPVKVDAPEETAPLHAGETLPLAQEEQTLDASITEEEPVHADLSERTEPGCYLHETLFYAPCGHSVQRRTALPAKLTGLTRSALEAEAVHALPRAAITGFSSKEVDVARSLDIPCPLHWVLMSGEDGMIGVFQNRRGETLDLVRRTDIPAAQAGEGERDKLLSGMIFDDVQALEGYLESLSS